MFCPNCLSEYDEDSTWCEQCEVELVEADEGEGEIEFLPLLEVTEMDLFGQVTGCLEEAGIAWFVQSEESLGLLPRDGSAEPGRAGESVATVYVDKVRLDQARRLCGVAETVSAG